MNEKKQEVEKTLHFLVADLVQLIIHYLPLLTCIKTFEHKEVSSLHVTEKWMVAASEMEFTISSFEDDLRSIEKRSRRAEDMPEEPIGIVQDTLLLLWNPTYASFMSLDPSRKGEEPYLYSFFSFNCHHGWLAIVDDGDDGPDGPVVVVNEITQKRYVIKEKFIELHVVDHDLFGVIEEGSVWRIPIESHQMTDFVDLLRRGERNSIFLPIKIFSGRVRATLHQYVPGFQRRDHLLFLYDLENKLSIRHGRL